MFDIERLCGNGVLDASEQCDQGAANGTSGSCCNSDCTFTSAGTVCRPSAGGRDVAEVCSGSSGTCPPDDNPTCTPAPTSTPVTPQATPGTACGNLTGTWRDSLLSRTWNFVEESDGTVHTTSNLLFGSDVNPMGYGTASRIGTSVTWPALATVPGVWTACDTLVFHNAFGSGWDMTFTRLTRAACGDGVLNAGEGCDDGNAVNGDGCNLFACFPHPGDQLDFGMTCDFCVSVPAGCGNGIVDSGEQCDEGASNGTATGCCTVACQFAPNGAACDDGNACTQTDACDGNGSCLGSNPAVCGPRDQCHLAGECDPASGCSNPVAADGTTCDAGNGCPQPDTCQLGTCIATECVSAPVIGGGTVTTDTQGNGATPTEPVQTAVTAPDGGTIAITETAATGTPPTGFALVGEQVTVSAPAATPDVPLVLVFLIDSSRIPAGADQNAIRIFKDGVLVPACTGAFGVASPDPCVSNRQLLTNGDVQITVWTSTASVWTFAVSTCGNGVLDHGEQCDDGNQVDGDGCSATCQSELISGGGSIATDCTHEWQAALVPARNSKGVPATRQTCTEGDPACDAGPAGDNTCTFHVAMCFNVTEQRFTCTPTDVARVRVQAGMANRDALETALGGLQGVVRGQCTRPRVKVGQLCQVNADCDSTPDSGNGRCKGNFVAFEPPLSTTNACTDFASINVPLRQTTRGLRKGTATLKLTAYPSNDPVTGKKRLKDTDALTLVCKPGT